MIVLGINAYHGDASAVLLEDGELVCAAEEERFRRVKHWAGFPSRAIGWCLDFAGVRPAGVDHIAVSRDPKANLSRKVLFAARTWPRFSLVCDRLRNAARVRDVRARYCEAFGLRPHDLRATLHRVEHHVAHLGSAFLVSPFDRAAVASVDGFGDFVSTMCALGRGGDIEVLNRVYFPHSLGLLYLAITQYLGFPKYGDEYKVMGLAAYGEAAYLDAMRRLVRPVANGRFELNLDYFRHHNAGATMTWDDGAPAMDAVYSPKLEELLGPARKPDERIMSRHEDISASLQAIYEEIVFHVLRWLYETTKVKRLALAGGCAMNSVANGKIFERTPFEEVYIQPAAGDNGTALGAAYYVWNHVLGHAKRFEMRRAYWGPEYSEEDIERAIKAAGCRIASGGAADCAPDRPGRSEGGDGSALVFERIENEDTLLERTAAAVADGKIVGWFQGRMEWGARALGNRSILADPRRADMRDAINTKIKFREKFRPFAPSILQEATGEYFTMDYPDPFMLKVYPIRAEKQSLVPAVTHVDGTGRLQTVTCSENPLYYRLISAFRDKTGVPLVLNTSFNENEPICCSPEEALACFLRTKMDALVIGRHFCMRRAGRS